MTDSKYLAHFTKGGNAYNNLISILTGCEIKANKLPWNNREAVCFTECPWASLVNHVINYSSYGIGFSKPHVFAAGGGPAYYVRPDIFEAQTWVDNIYTFVTPFSPSYRPEHLKTSLGGKTVDYAHEREWRVPHSFTFELSQIEFIILNSYKDMAEFPLKLKDSIGRDKFILMDVYKKIEELWPTHIISK